MLNEGVILLTALFGTEACGMSSAERRKVNVLEMKCGKNSFMWKEWMSTILP